MKPTPKSYLFLFFFFADKLFKLVLKVADFTMPVQIVTIFCVNKFNSAIFGIKPSQRCPLWVKLKLVQLNCPVGFSSKVWLALKFKANTKK